MKKVWYYGILISCLFFICTVPSNLFAASINLHETSIPSTNQTISIPLSLELDENDTVTSLNFAVTFDDTQLAFSDVSITGNLVQSEKLIDAHQVYDDQINVIIYGLNTYTMTSGIVAYINFAVTNNFFDEKVHVAIDTITAVTSQTTPSSLAIRNHPISLNKIDKKDVLVTPAQSDIPQDSPAPEEEIRNTTLPPATQTADDTTLVLPDSNTANPIGSTPARGDDENAVIEEINRIVHHIDTVYTEVTLPEEKGEEVPAETEHAGTSEKNIPEDTDEHDGIPDVPSPQIPEVITIKPETIERQNNKPTITIRPRYQNVHSGALVMMQIRARDIDNDSLKIMSCSKLPRGARLRVYHEGTAILQWRPRSYNTGTYHFKFLVNDGRTYASCFATVVVEKRRSYRYVQR